MKRYLCLLILFFSLSLQAQPLDGHYLDSCEKSKGQLKAVEQSLALRGGRPLARTSPLFNKSKEDCFTQPKDVKLTDEEVQQTRGAGGTVGVLRTGLARSRLGSEKMKERFDRCSADHDALQQAIKDDREQLHDQISERQNALKQYEEQARRNYVPAAEQQPHIDRFRKEIRELEDDVSKTGQVSSYARDAYREMISCYGRLQHIYDTAAYDYEKGLAMSSADDVGMASAGPTGPRPEGPKDDRVTQLGNAAADKLEEHVRTKAVQKPIEEGIKQGAKAVARQLATQVPKKLVGGVAGAVADIVIPDANPGGACSGAPLDDPWKRYNAGCFRVNSVGSAISILQRP